MLLMAAATFGLFGQARAATVTFLGLQYTSIGNATLQIVNGTLIVSNIGPTGADGVSVALPLNTSLWNPVINNLGAASGTPIDSFINLDSYTRFFGEDALVSSIHSTHVSNTLFGNAVVSQFGRALSQNVTANYFLGSSKVATEAISMGSVFASDFWPDDWDLSASRGFLTLVDGSLSWLNAGNITSPSGSVFFADRMEVI
jgi:hypothetical protein